MEGQQHLPDIDFSYLEIGLHSNTFVDFHFFLYFFHFLFSLVSPISKNDIKDWLAISQHPLDSRYLDVK